MLPMRKTKIIHANQKSIVFETVIGKDYRLTIPASLKDKIDVTKVARITIEQP
jgi:bifunctional DNA-binding transcriptional regulator/antitoxin component of YhaV-PrlF toxin-antitoxin module